MEKRMKTATYDASQMTADLEITNLAPVATDREQWATIKHKFDLHAVQPGLVTVPVEQIVEEIASDDQDFNVHEIVSISTQECSQRNEHNYA